jgi:Arc/MetJ-type ribon-helix-helix transcriptional regulator
MPIEAGYIKPVVDAILGLVKKGSNAKLQRDAAKAVREAIRELLLADPNENEVEAKIAIAKAAGLISHDVLLADEMLEKVKSSKKKMPSKASTKKSTTKTAVKKETKTPVKKTLKKPEK